MSHRKILVFAMASVVLLGASVIPWPAAVLAEDRRRPAWDHLYDAVAYLYAVGLEHRWSGAHTRTKSELEPYLWLYSERVIKPSESGWGREYQLKPGERMVQYLILWRAPLEVVYDSTDEIQAIFTSYE